MKSVRLLVVISAVTGLGIATHANATVREVVLSGAHVPTKADRPFWDNVGAEAKVTDAANPTTYHYADSSIPIDGPTVGNLNVTVLLEASGGGATSNVCFAVYSRSSSGALSAFAGSACTSGVVGHEQLTRTITVGPQQAVLSNFAAQNNGAVRYLHYSY